MDRWFQFFGFFVIFSIANGGIVTYVDFTSLQHTNSHNRDGNFEGYTYEPKGSDRTIAQLSEDEDPNYPYEQLLKLVQETKKILNSSDPAEKRKLVNFAPSNYQAYLRGDFSDVTMAFDLPSNIFPASASAGLPGLNSGCRKETKILYPKRLKSLNGQDYYILNVGNQFVQRLNTVVCRFPGRYCGDSSTWQENRSYICDQSYGRIKKFFSVPVNAEISVEQQNVHEFMVPDDCICKGTRDYF